MAWPPRDIEVLKDLAAKCLSARQIASRLGRSRNSVIGMCDRLKQQGVDIQLRGDPSKPPRPPRTRLCVQNVRRARRKRTSGAHTSPEQAAPQASLPACEQPEEVRDTETPPVRTPHLLPLSPSFSDKIEAYLAMPEHQCRWPIGEPRDEDFCFCKLPRVDKSPYCARHSREAFNGWAW